MQLSSLLRIVFKASMFRYVNIFKYGYFVFIVHMCLHGRFVAKLVQPPIQGGTLFFFTLPAPQFMTDKCCSFFAFLPWISFTTIIVLLISSFFYSLYYLHSPLWKFLHLSYLQTWNHYHQYGKPHASVFVLLHSMFCLSFMVTQITDTTGV